MNKIIILAAIMTFTIPLISMQVFAAEESTQTGVVDVGNKKCPVMGGAVSGNDFVIHNGKRYALCCPGCKSTFLSDPEKYAAIAESQKGE